MNDEFWMRKALQLAKHAELTGEVPVGALVVLNEEVIGEGWSCPIGQIDPTGHAEIIALRHAAQQIKNYRLVQSTLYVTLEPCAMCVGALIHARVKRLVFGALDVRAGAVVSALSLLTAPHFNHKVEFTAGILQEECGKLLKDFFAARR